MAYSLKTRSVFESIFLVFFAVDGCVKGFYKVKTVLMLVVAAHFWLLLRSYFSILTVKLKKYALFEKEAWIYKALFVNNMKALNVQSLKQQLGKTNNVMHLYRLLIENTIIVLNYYSIHCTRLLSSTPRLCALFSHAQP